MTLAHSHKAMLLVPLALLAGVIIGFAASVFMGGVTQVSAYDPCAGTQSFFDWQTGTTRFGTVLPRSQPQQFDQPGIFDRRGRTRIDRWFDEGR
jgi:hypothetical protein